MRPLKLKINGLRSYRTEQEIDFTDVDLMAIIGDTGAGKSSLLEALCVALYGSCTWDARSAKPLIADGGPDTMEVELTFRAKDRTWRVYRGISRGQYPPARHHLKCLDDETSIDNADGVNAEIRQLIGLDYPTFLKTVLLPQGRFQVLLQMSNTDRTPVLKTILGLDRLSDIKEEAQTLVHELRPKIGDLRTLRGRLLPAPDAVATDAQTRLDQATKRRTELDDAKCQIAASRTGQTASTDRIKLIRQATQRLAEASIGDAGGDYQRLAALDAQLGEELTANRSRTEELERQEHDLDAAFCTADEKGVGISGLAAAAKAITTLIRDVPEIDAERGRCAEVSADIRTDHNEMVRRATILAERRQAAEQTEAAAGDARTLADAAADRYAIAKARLGNARAANTAAADAAAAVASAEENLRRLEEALGQAVKESQEAEIAKQAVAEQVDAIRRDNSAAHAASASQPGDPCPICARTLPNEFVAPQAPGTAQAETVLAKAEQNARRLANQASAAEANRLNAHGVLEEATASAHHAGRAREAAIAEAEALLPNVDLARDDVQLLEPVQGERDRTAQARGEAERIALDDRDAVTAATAELDPIRKSLADREKDVAAAEQGLQRRIDGLMKQLGSVPEPYRVPEPLTVGALNGRLALVHERQKELELDAENLRGIRRELATLRRDAEALLVRRRAEVESPSAELRSRVEVLAERACAAADLVGQPEPPTRVAGTLVDDAVWAGAVMAAVRDLADECSAEVTRLQEDVRQAQAAAEAVWAVMGLADEAALEDALRSVIEDAGAARKDLAMAKQHQPLAADLDRRLAKTEPLVAALDELIRLLNDGKFVGAVVRRKQRALLGVASEILLSMTRSRFGFAESFQIIDKRTGQPRDVKTLSGGETFLASLALALALVELAGRGGGRLEALFLDEGFGSLDAYVINDALDALGQQSESGRLVAVISHLRSIVEGFENVLVVTKGPNGSQIHWAKGDERDQLITEELRAGLIS